MPEDIAEENLFLPFAKLMTMPCLQRLSALSKTKVNVFDKALWCVFLKLWEKFPVFNHSRVPSKRKIRVSKGVY